MGPSDHQLSSNAIERFDAVDTYDAVTACQCVSYADVSTDSVVRDVGASTSGGTVMIT